MSADDLAALAAEIPSDDPEPVEDADAPDAVADDPAVAFKPTDAGMVAIVAVLVRAVGSAVCLRAQVSPLSDAEVEGIAEAAANLAAQYDFTMSPLAAAWLGLGVAVAGVALPRMEEAGKRKAVPKGATAKPADAPAPVRSLDDLQAEIDAANGEAKAA